VRIVSLVPSITETLFDFGLTEKELVGRTKFCIHPADSVKKIPIIGGTKNLHKDKIRALKPDLIIANKEENEKQQVEELMDCCDVWVTDVSNLEDNAAFLVELGKCLSNTALAEEFNQKISSVFNFKKPRKTTKVAYLIWKDPYMSVGGDTFIHDVLSGAGLLNVFADRTRYPVVALEELEAAEVILLSSEPYPFREKHLAELQALLPGKKIVLVDGEVFSWFGSHLAHTGDYLSVLQQQL